MADKEKRLRKILARICLKGLLKPTKTFEEAHTVLVEIDKDQHHVYTCYKKEEYKQLLEEGYIFPENKVHFLVATNPRNRRQVEQSIMSNKFGSIKYPTK